MNEYIGAGRKQLMLVGRTPRVEAATPGEGETNQLVLCGEIRLATGGEDFQNRGEDSTSRERIVVSGDYTNRGDWSDGMKK